jgi:hypothetical protein
MACVLTTGRTLPCKDAVGGLQKIFLCDYDTLGTLTIVDGVLTAIGGNPDLFEYDIKGASNLEQTITTSRDNGTTFYEQTLTMVLTKLDPETQVELQNVIGGRPHAFVLDNNGNYLALGLTRGCDVTGGSISTGSQLGDMSGYSITLVGQEPLMATFVSSSVISDHLDGTQIDA